MRIQRLFMAMPCTQVEHETHNDIIMTLPKSHF